MLNIIWIFPFYSNFYFLRSMSIMPLGAIIFLVIFSIMFAGAGFVLLLVGISVNHGITIIGGILFATAGLAPMVIWLRKVLIKRYVLKHGVIIHADFLDYVSAQYSIQGYVPTLLRAQWLDEKNNLVYHFKSTALPREKYGKCTESTKIRVYINPKNPKHYYVDLTSI